MSTSPRSATVVLATGSYTSPGRGRGSGVRLLALDEQALTAEELARVELEDPSFVMWNEDGTMLYAVQETTPTRLAAVRCVDGRRLEVAGTLELRGSEGCHVGPGRVPGTLVVTDYGSGSVEVVRLDENGVPEAVIDVCEHGEYIPGRNGHPHQSVLLPGTDLIGITDLGLDRVYLYRQDPSGTIDLAGEITAHRFSGPRHLAADHESRTLYLACELAGTVVDAVRSSEPHEGDVPTWSVGQPIPASGSGTEGGDPSHIELSGRENHVIVANRGHDTVAVLNVGMMRPELVSEIPVGRCPRHFARRDDLLLVAAQEGDRIDLLSWDGAELERAAEPLAAPSVSCIALRP